MSLVEWVASAISILTLIVLTVTLIYIARQANEAARIRLEQARPHVVVHFAFSQGILVQIVIRNIGRTIARDIHLTWDRPLTSTLFGTRFEKMAAFTSGIPSLAPAQEIRVHFDSLPKRVETPEMPMTYACTVAYAGSGEKGPRYEEAQVLDLNVFVQAARMPKGPDDIARQMEEVVREIRKWSDTRGGLLVHALDRHRTSFRQDLPYAVSETRRIQHERGVREAIKHVWGEVRSARGWYSA